MATDIRICFIGDSFVNGTGDETALGWAGRLCAAAATSGVPITYYNLGIRRDTSRDVLLRWESECARRLPESCDGHIVISCGANDTTFENGNTRIDPDESCANIRRVLAGVKRYPLILVGPPPVDDDNHNARIESLSGRFADEAARAGVPYIEIYSQLVVDRAYRQAVSNNDGAHPTSGGYSRMADVVGRSADWWFNAAWSRRARTSD